MKKCMLAGFGVAGVLLSVLTVYYISRFSAEDLGKVKPEKPAEAREWRALA